MSSAHLSNKSRNPSSAIRRIAAKIVIREIRCFLCLGLLLTVSEVSLKQHRETGHNKKISQIPPKGSIAMIALLWTLVVATLADSAFSTGADGSSEKLPANKFLLTPANIQQNHDNSSGFELAVYILKSVLVEQNDRGNWSNIGAGLELGYRFQSGAVLELRANFRSWENRDEFYLPLVLGPRFDWRPHPRLTLSPFAGFGPALLIGNDYGGIFAGFDMGLRLSTKVSRKAQFLIGASYGQGVAFHPANFGYMNFIVGVGF